MVSRHNTSQRWVRPAGFVSSCYNGKVEISCQRLSKAQNKTFVTEDPHLLKATRQNGKPHQVMNQRDRMRVINCTCRELTQRWLFRLRRRGRRHDGVPVAPWWVSTVRGVGPWPVRGAPVWSVVGGRLLRLPGHARGEDRHRPRPLLVWCPGQGPRSVLQSLLVWEVSGAVVVREVPVDVDVLKHCLLTGEGVQQLKYWSLLRVTRPTCTHQLLTQMVASLPGDAQRSLPVVVGKVWAGPGPQQQSHGFWLVLNDTVVEWSVSFLCLPVKVTRVLYEKINNVKRAASFLWNGVM